MGLLFHVICALTISSVRNCVPEGISALARMPCSPLFTSGEMKDRDGVVRGKRVHEDLGEGYYAGVRIHEYRDTTTMNPGSLGNDLPMVSVRRYKFSPELGFNLTSTIEAPQLGQQVFSVTEISTTEPDPKYFDPPAGYQVVDHRKE